MAPRTRHEHAVIRNFSRGFAAFPTELLHHVASHIEGTTVPWHQDSPFVGQRNERRDLLRVLSQLCRSLRTALLPLVWQSVEAYTLLPPPFDGKWRRGHMAVQAKGISKELLGQLKLVRNAKQPYASHVRIITVAIYSKDALARLAHAMTLMPNLHTVHIMCGPYFYAIGDDEFQKAFSGLVFPSVRRVILPAQAKPTFECFPEVLEVLSNHPLIFDLSQFLGKMISHCPKVESVGWRELSPTIYGGPFPRDARYVVENLPNLRRMKYYMMRYRVDEIMGLLPLNLEKITLVSDGGDSEEAARMVAAAQHVLAGSSLPNKCLEVILGDERRTIDIPDKAS